MQSRGLSVLFLFYVYMVVCKHPPISTKKQKPSAMLCIFALSTHHSESKGITHINGVEPI